MLELLKANWKYVICILIGVFLGILLGRVSKPKESIQVTASQAQSGSIETASHIQIKPREPIASIPGCPPCPQLPEITVDCGGSAKGSQGQSITATASVQNSSISLYVGLGSTFDGQLDASCMVAYGSWGLLGSYGQNNAYGAKVLFKALEF